MFEKEIKFISDFTLNKVKNLGSSFTFKKLSTAGLHPAIFTYISAELDYLIYTDRKKLLENSMFDYSGKTISEQFNKIGGEIKQNKLISYDDFKKLVNQAVSFNVNYVVRPKWSITKLIYNEQQFVSVEEMERMLNYLYYYDYIKNVLSAYLSKRKVLQLTLTEFDLILNKIDRELFKANSEELINNALLSIGDFFNIGGVDKNKISVQAVEILLKEKNLTDYLMKLHRAIPNGSKKKYDIEDIKNVFYSTTPIEPDSISGYDVEEVKLTEEEPAAEVDEEENFSIEDEIMNAIGVDDLTGEETVKDKVPASPSTDSESEDLLPVEDEFLIEEKEELIVDKPETDVEQVGDGLMTEINEEFNEGNAEETLTEEIEYIDGESLNSRDESGSVSSEETVEKNKVEEDELLSFYEQELAALPDELSITKNQPEETDTQVSVEDAEPENMSPVEEVKNENETQDENVNLVEDDFDLSIFDSIGEEEKTKPESVAEEHISENENDVEDFLQSKDILSKEIVDEMIEDFFRDEKKDETESSEESAEAIADEPSLEMPEGGTEKLLDEDEDETGTEEMGDIDLINSTIDKLDVEDDISDATEDIDKILEDSGGAKLDLPEIPDEKFSESVLNELPLEEIEEDNIQDFTPEEIEYNEPSSSEETNFTAEPETETEPENVFDEITDEAKESDVFTFEETSEDQKQDDNQVVSRQKDMFSYLKKKEIKKIISNVFSGDDEDFVTTVERISECATYKEATEILKDVFFSYRVSPYSKEAVIFTNAVSNYFRQS